MTHNPCTSLLVLRLWSVLTSPFFQPYQEHPYILPHKSLLPIHHKAKQAVPSTHQRLSVSSSFLSATTDSANRSALNNAHSPTSLHGQHSNRHMGTPYSHTEYPQISGIFIVFSFLRKNRSHLHPAFRPISICIHHADNHRYCLGSIRNPCTSLLVLRLWSARYQPP